MRHNLNNEMYGISFSPCSFIAFLHKTNSEESILFIQTCIIHMFNISEMFLFRTSVKHGVCVTHMLCAWLFSIAKKIIFNIKPKKNENGTTINEIEPSHDDAMLFLNKRCCLVLINGASLDK
ncbi:hypothetical protein EJH33_26095 [Salmonella enterica subsp. enterica serovar Eastbourne]|nr:hypothetical protein [Salmonella enterica subsp. enterica serovar Eastbourne]